MSLSSRSAFPHQTASITPLVLSCVQCDSCAADTLLHNVPASPREALPKIDGIILGNANLELSDFTLLVDTRSISTGL